ncbi:hypothetical protein PTKIN_Ptkin15bG0146300 [Pterospermum kingtungense]
MSAVIRDAFLEAIRSSHLQIFDAMKRWKVLNAERKYEVWIQMEGIPLDCWNMQFFKKLGDSWGEFIKIDEDTLFKNRLNLARMLVRVKSRFDIPSQITVTIRGSNCKLSVMVDDSFSGDWNVKAEQRPRCDWVTEKQGCRLGSPSFDIVCAMASYSLEPSDPLGHNYIEKWALQTVVPKTQNSEFGLETHNVDLGIKTQISPIQVVFMDHQIGAQIYNDEEETYVECGSHNKAFNGPKRIQGTLHPINGRKRFKKKSKLRKTVQEVTREALIQEGIMSNDSISDANISHRNRVLHRGAVGTVSVFKSDHEDFILEYKRFRKEGKAKEKSFFELEIRVLAERFILVVGVIKHINLRCGIDTVYAPNDDGDHALFWEELSAALNSVDVP